MNGQKGDSDMSKWDRLGWLAGGALLGSYGIKILFSKPANKKSRGN